MSNDTGQITCREHCGTRSRIDISTLYGDDLRGVKSRNDFIALLEGLRQTRGLIVDLRNTPRGGNTGVAEGMLGRFVERELPYQKHAVPAAPGSAGPGRSWFEQVPPRGSFTYTRPVAILVSRWTGSMGEGLAIGFDATSRGMVVGTPMAGLGGDDANRAPAHGNWHQRSVRAPLSRGRNAP